MSGVREETRFAWRALARTPAFTLVAVFTLALGLGAAATILAVGRNVLLRPLPYADPDRLIRIWSNSESRRLSHFSVSVDDYLTWRENNTTLEAMSAYDRQEPRVLTGHGEASQVEVANIAPDLIPLLGVAPALGRAVTQEEAERDAPVVVVSDRFWKNELGGAQDVLGHTLVFDGEPHTVIGVMPPGFMVPFNSAVAWTPLRLEPGSRGNRFLRVLARTRPDAQPAEVAAELGAIATRLASEFPATNTDWDVRVQTVHETIVGESFRQALIVLLGVVAIVWLIACANVSNLLLSRLIARRHEVAVRSAIGASRRRLAAHWLFEGALLGALASGPALLFALWATMLLRTMDPAAVPRVDEIRIDLPVVLGTIAIAVLGGAVLGGLPGMLAARTGGSGLTEHGRGVSGGVQVGRLRSLVLVGEITLSVTLLIGTMLLARSFQHVRAVNPGFDAEGVIVAAVSLPPAAYDRNARPQFFSRLLERVAALPGVEAAAAVTSAPFGGPNTGDIFLPEHMIGSAFGQPPDADIRVVTTDFFRTLRLPLLSGRSFTPADADGEPAGVISRTMARLYWPGIDPVGTRMRLGNVETGPFVRVIGVVEDARYQSLEDATVRPMMYFLHARTSPAPSMQLVVRVGGPRDAVVAGVRRTLDELDPELALSAVAPMTDMVGEAFAERRFQVMLFALFAGIALVLALVGLYGVLSMMVAQRTRELGVRLALGARGADVIRLVLRRGVRITLAGLVLGTIAALGLTRLLRALLFQTSPTEPFSFLAAGTLVLTIAMVACYLPARRAARLDAATALRT